MDEVAALVEQPVAVVEEEEASAPVASRSALFANQ